MDGVSEGLDWLGSGGSETSVRSTREWEGGMGWVIYVARRKGGRSSGK